MVCDKSRRNTLVSICVQGLSTDWSLPICFCSVRSSSTLCIKKTLKCVKYGDSVKKMCLHKKMCIIQFILIIATVTQSRWLLPDGGSYCLQVHSLTEGVIVCKYTLWQRELLFASTVPDRGTYCLQVHSVKCNG